jgi:DNA polymerase III subunit delta'
MNIIGHKKIINFLDKSIEKDKISHAYLFSGPKHLGKFTVALEFAKKITGGLDKRINPHTKNSKEYNFGVGVNPDIIIISPEIEEKNGNVKKKDIKIEKIRDLEHELSLTAYFGKHRVAIIDGADYLTRASQNALLKTLEEPPKKVVIILITENSNKIIPTIKSRCVVKKFGLIKNSEIAGIIQEKKDEKKLNFWSLSRPGLAINFQKEGEEIEKREKAEKDLGKMLEINLSEKLSFCEELSKNNSEMINELNFWIVLLRENILGKNNFFQLSQKRSLDIILEIEKSLKILNETNSNPKLVMENLVLEFHPME